MIRHLISAPVIQNMQIYTMSAIPHNTYHQSSINKSNVKFSVLTLNKPAVSVSVQTGQRRQNLYRLCWTSSEFYHAISVLCCFYNQSKHSAMEKWKKILTLVMFQSNLHSPSVMVNTAHKTKQNFIFNKFILTWIIAQVCAKQNVQFYKHIF